MKSIINRMTEKFSNGTIETVAHDDNDWEIGKVSLDIDTTIERKVGGLLYTVTLTFFGAQVETSEIEYFVNDDNIIDRTKIDIDVDDDVIPPTDEIVWVRSQHK